MTAPSRPVLRWLGGKKRLAPWIIEQFPRHDLYVEPYGGAFSVGLAKPRVYNEVYNDLDDELVNLFRVLRGDRAEELLRQLALTPYAEQEYRLALQRCDDPLEKARRCVVRSHMAHGTGSARIDRPTGFRSDGRSGTTNVAGEWSDLSAALQVVVERLRGVTIRQVPALDLMRLYDDPKALIYLDPPYLPATRSRRNKGGERYHCYVHEMDDQDHADLLTECRRSTAMIALSGYDDPLYANALTGWTVRRVAARAHRNSPRTETLWLNAAAVARQPAPMLIAEVA